MESTCHKIINGDSRQMSEIKDKSIHLVVTSPPYPMMEMWDEIMSEQNSEIKKALNLNNGLLAFELMHLELDKIWKEVERVLIPGGFACINIGDATRTINDEFALYPNHSRIITTFQKLGLSNLPNIIWRKQTNAPNKFMGSGTLPSGAYVTLEHEWVLIFRKGGKRQFKTEEEKLRRKESAFFWEERNIWFSDLWDLKGTKQKVDNSESRKRSAAYPFDLPYRLINMYSLKGDIILDPFLGTGTSTIAAIATQRNSVGYEIDKAFSNIAYENIETTPIDFYNSCVYNRMNSHKQFISDRNADPNKDDIKHFNENLDMQVMMNQETEIKLAYVNEIKKEGEGFAAKYENARPDGNSISVPLMKKLKPELTLF